jgi:hypothetical protein
VNRLFSVFAGILLVVSFVASGCASAAAPVSGGLWMDVKGPFTVAGDGAVSSTKVGKATAGSILGWIATGDASIEAAAKAGEITKISHVDHHSTNIIGILADYTTIVYGE